MIAIKKILRRPVLSGVFVFVIMLVTMFLTIGIHLLYASHKNMKEMERTFTTMGTAEEIESGIETSVVEFVTGEKLEIKKSSYQNIGTEVINELEMDFIHPIEKRPYYAAYSEKLNQANFAHNRYSLVEFIPVTTEIQKGQIKVILNKVLETVDTQIMQLEGTEMWLCPELLTNLSKLRQGEKYVAECLLISGHEKSEGEMELMLSPEPIWGIENVSGEVTAKKLTGRYEEVTEGFYESRKWKAFKNSHEYLMNAEGIFSVIPTNALHLFVPFHENEMVILEGREITEEEFENGAQVCLISDSLARPIGCRAGDDLTLELREADYRDMTHRWKGYHRNRGGDAPYFGVDENGDRIKPFQVSSYKVVGIYKQASDVNKGEFYYGDEIAIIPMKSVQASDIGNVIADGPMMKGNTSFEIPNGEAENFMKVFSGKNRNHNIQIQFYDNGYMKMKKNIDHAKQISIVLLVVGGCLLVGVILLYIFFFVADSKLDIAIERGLGISRRKCMTALVISSALFTFIGSLAGGAAGNAICGKASGTMIESMKQRDYDTSYSSHNVYSSEEKEVSGEWLEAGWEISVLSVFLVLLTENIFLVSYAKRLLDKEPMELFAESDRR